MAFLKIFRKEKELFSVAFSQRYGSLYQKYHFRKGIFNTIQICKIIVIAVWIALLYEHPVPQLILIALTLVVSAYFNIILIIVFDKFKIYLVLLLVMQPYADHIHYFTDLVVTVLQVVFFLLILGFRDHSKAQHWALGVVIVHILALAVIVVGIASNILKWNGISDVSDLKRTVSHTDSEGIMGGMHKEHRVSSSDSMAM